MELLITYLLLALAISFICSVSETVLLSSSISFIKTCEEKGKKNAHLLKKYKEDIDKPLSAILTLNTVSHTIGAAGVGAQAILVFGEASFGIISAILTILILLLSEILPKSIGARYWRTLVLPFTQIIKVMILITLPVVWISKGISKLVAAGDIQEKVSREEIAALTQIGLEEGVFAETESKIIHNLIKLRSIKANEIMTPRTVVASVSEDMELQDFFNLPDVSGYSRFPVYEKTKDNITGYVLKYDIIDSVAKKQHKYIRDIKRPIHWAYENTTIPNLFDDLLEKKEQIAVLVDEYGVMNGIVSLEDIIETIFGHEIVDEKDIRADMQELAKEKWKERAIKDNLNIEGLEE